MSGKLIISSIIFLLLNEMKFNGQMNVMQGNINKSGSTETVQHTTVCRLKWALDIKCSFLNFVLAESGQLERAQTTLPPEQHS